MDTQRIQQLLKIYATGQLSAAEEAELALLLEIPVEVELIDPVFKAFWTELQPDTQATVAESVRIADSIWAKDHEEMSYADLPVHRVHFLKTAWFRWAAAIIIIAGIGTYIFSRTAQSDKEVAQVTLSPVFKEVLPGSDRAVLTLSSGAQVPLSQAASHTINDGTVSIVNTDGQLNYLNVDLALTNTMTTPKGGQYKLTLADGTRVWLNAASSITFPTAFKEASREVSITGEVYFEVAQNKSKPFVVRTATELITVLGTSFNVNSYTDEASTKTSLIEGKIKVNGAILYPGTAYTGGKVISTNLTHDIAWKNGEFDFDHINIREAMRQIARWYDIEVEYKGNIPDIEFIGGLDRSLPLSELLEALKKVNVKFELHDRTVTVTP